MLAMKEMGGREEDEWRDEEKLQRMEEEEGDQLLEECRNLRCYKVERLTHAFHYFKKEKHRIGKINRQINQDRKALMKKMTEVPPPTKEEMDLLGEEVKRLGKEVLRLKSEWDIVGKRMDPWSGVNTLHPEKPRLAVALLDSEGKFRDVTRVTTDNEAQGNEEGSLVGQAAGPHKEDEGQANVEGDQMVSAATGRNMDGKLRRDVPGMSPLMKAVRAGDFDIVEIFVDARADCSILEELWEYLPLYWNVNTPNNSQEALQIMKKDGLFNLASECYQLIEGLPHLDLCMVELSTGEETPFVLLFDETAFTVAFYLHAMPISLLLWSHGQEEQLQALKSYLDAGLPINPTRLDVSHPLAFFLNHKASRGLTNSLHLSILHLLESRGLDPDYTSKDNTFGVPDALVAASMSDSRTLAFLLAFSRTTPEKILDWWAGILMGSDGGVRVVREDHQTLFAAHMKATCSVAVELGRHCLGQECVKRFQVAVEAATEEEADWEDLKARMDCVPTLQHLCRWNIRQALSESLHPGQLVKGAVKQLKLPEIMKSFLVYSDVDLLKFPIGQG